MKFKKKLFPFVLVFALLLTATGLVTANISFSKPITNSNSYFNVNIDNVNSVNTNVIGYDKTNLTYVVDFNDLIKDYVITFDVFNESSVNVVLTNKNITSLPEELNGIVSYEETISNSIESNKIDTVTIKYTVKDNLTKEEKNIVNKYNNYKVNILLNYNQE